MAKKRRRIKKKRQRFRGRRPRTQAQNQYIQDYQDSILTHNHDLPIPPNDMEWEVSDSFPSWFQTKELPCTPSKVQFPYRLEQSLKVPKRRAIRVDLHLTETQKTILGYWFHAYTKMYNSTLWAARQHGVYNWNWLRTYRLLERKKSIQEEFRYNKDSKYQIQGHMLDGAIKRACAMYKSAITNKARGNIKRFRIRFWKYSDCNRIVDIEPVYITKGSICPKILGTIRATYDGHPYDLRTVDCESTLSFRYTENKYVLYVPQRIQAQDVPASVPVISLDPGIATFMTGLSTVQATKWGTNVSAMIRKQLTLLEQKKKDPHILHHQKKDVHRRIQDKIRHMVDDLHWKVIGGIIRDHQNILIGNMSTQGIISNATSILNPITKKVVQRMRHYEFRQRLLYKAALYRRRCVVVNERYTSKMCSYCGQENETLGLSRDFFCQGCYTEMDRDVNGCRGIYIRTHQTKQMV